MQLMNSSHDPFDQHQRIRLTKQFNFEMAHAIDSHDGPCRNIHGHSYRLSVTVSGSVIREEDNPELGMVMDFKHLKRIVREHIVDPFDHSLVLEKTSPYHKTAGRTILVDFQPTCENLLVYFKGLLASRLPKRIRLERLVLRETADSYAEWLLEDNIP
jgi:6-pyruvoyltetrahydropterin/6-carboxytetrahydropterin synthase